MNGLSNKPAFSHARDVQGDHADSVPPGPNYATPRDKRLRLIRRTLMRRLAHLELVAEDLTFRAGSLHYIEAEAIAIELALKELDLWCRGRIDGIKEGIRRRRAERSEASQP